jgi:hypothetical protein
MAKTASPSATEGIGIQVATGTIAGRDSPAFGWPKLPALQPQHALVQVATRTTAGSVSPALFLVAKPASSSATEGIGIQVARGTTAGRESPAF